MARVGVSITKTFSFRGAAQEFSNTYYYETPLPVIASVATGLIDAVVALEKPMHGSQVTFLRGRCWTTGGTKAENNMLADKPLSGTGTAGTGGGSSLDRERAFLVRFRAGNDSRGRPVYLRKWWHLDIMTVGGYNLAGGSVLQNTEQLPTAARNQLVTWADAFKNVFSAPQNFELVSKNGREIDGATTAHPYLEHHQLGDMWRG